MAYYIQYILKKYKRPVFFSERRLATSSTCGVLLAVFTACVNIFFRCLGSLSKRAMRPAMLFWMYDVDMYFKYVWFIYHHLSNCLTFSGSFILYLGDMIDVHIHIVSTVGFDHFHFFQNSEIQRFPHPEPLRFPTQDCEEWIRHRYTLADRPGGDLTLAMATDPDCPVVMFFSLTSKTLQNDDKQTLGFVSFCIWLTRHTLRDSFDDWLSMYVHVYIHIYRIYIKSWTVHWHIRV